MNEISIVIIVLIIFMIIKAINQKRKSTVQTTQTFKKTEENTEKINIKKRTFLPVQKKNSYQRYMNLKNMI